LSGEVPRHELTRAEVEQLLQLIDRADFDVIDIEWKGLRLHLSRGQAGARPGVAPARAMPGPAAAPGPAAPAAPSGAPAGTGHPAAAKALRAAAVPDGQVPVAAPTMGTFYRAPEPGAAAFVELGDRVEAGATLGLIEVMKVFSAVIADRAGVVREIRAGDGALVEYGEILVVIEPDA
jgi:acetyl-CoA carboxylase biotin carboxyl carrier protein